MTDADSAPALFVPDGECWVPTIASRGPWTPDALHGGPVAALVARAVEGCDSPVPSTVTRLTVELLKPVPLVPLSLWAGVVRPGRRIQVVDVRVRAGDTDVAWGRAVRIRTDAALADAGGVSAAATAPTEGAASPPGGGDDDAPPPPETGAPPERTFTDTPAFHNLGVELRFVRGRFDTLGPAQVWIRLAVPVVPGETPSPLQRTAAAADFGNGVSSVVPFDRYVFVNPDLTIHFERMPEGDWIGLDAATRLGTPGTALAQSGLWDRRGPIGRALQGLYVDPRP